MWKRVATVLGMLLVLGGLVGVGCFDSDEEVTFTDALELAPSDTGLAVSVSITSVARIREHFGLGEIETVEEWEDILRVLSEADLWVPLDPLKNPYDDTTEVVWRPDFHLLLGRTDLLIVHQFGSADFMARGLFSGEALEARSAGCSDCETGDDWLLDGAAYFAWNVDLDERDRILEPLSRNRRDGQPSLILTDTLLLRSYSADTLGPVLDALAQGPSLADRESFALAAEAADELSLFAVEISDLTLNSALGPSVRTRVETQQQSDFYPPPRFGDERIAAWNPAAGEVLLLPYRAFAAGAGIDDDGAFVALVLIHDSEASARENVERLEERLLTAFDIYGQPWSHNYNSFEISSSGAVLIGKLRGERNFWTWFDENPLLLHE